MKRVKQSALKFFTTEEAMRSAAKAKGEAIYAKLEGWHGVFLIYPGGRMVYWNHSQVKLVK